MGIIKEKILRENVRNNKRKSQEKIKRKIAFGEEKKERKHHCDHEKVRKHAYDQ